MASKASSIQPRAAASRVRRCDRLACFRSWKGPIAMRGEIVSALDGCGVIACRKTVIQTNIAQLNSRCEKADSCRCSVRSACDQLCQTTGGLNPRQKTENQSR